MSDADKKDTPRYRELIEAVNNQTANEEQIEQLERILEESQEARDAFIRARSLEVALRRRYAVEGADIAKKSWRNPTVSMRSLLFIAGWTITACIAVAVFLRPFPKQSDELLDHGMAIVSNAVDAVWLDTEHPITMGATLPQGRVQLDQGLVQIDFYSGVSVILEGKADLEIVSSMEAILHEGKLRAHVPDCAYGFKIHSRHVEVVDLGTSFGMSVSNEEGTDIHVFRGKIRIKQENLNPSVTYTRELTAGMALRINNDGARFETSADSSEFVDVADLQARSAVNLQDRHQRWRVLSEQWRKDPRLIAYYTFEQDSQNPSQLKNIASPRKPSMTGVLVGCRWTQGRWPGKDALEFKQPGDRVRIRIPQTYESLTLMAWVRPDSLENNYNSLLMSDGWHRAGCVHWQLGLEGNLELGVWSSPEQKPQYRTERVLNAFDLGRWIHLAVVYNSQEKRVTHYLNGRVVGQMSKQEMPPLNIGQAQIGNWMTFRPNDPSAIRNFNGRIDELAVFSEALNASEIEEVYEIGKPQ